MSEVMTSRSIPSRGTKYSFWRAEAGICCEGGGLAFDLEAIAERVGGGSGGGGSSRKSGKGEKGGVEGGKRGRKGEGRPRSKCPTGLKVVMAMEMVM